MIKPQPYKIIPKIQHYEWGTKNRKALIPRFLGIKPESNLPYAELWFGTHPKSPSDILIENETYSLSEIIKKYPNEILGEKVSKKFSSTLPFLLKILSIEKALSIQTHPNKNVAKDLHKKDPKNYPDSNHKPEIAIAIDKLNAIVGLQSLENIKNSFIKYPQLNLLLSKKINEKLFSANLRLNQDFVKEVYSEVMNASNRKIKICVNSLLELISQKNKKTQIEKQFLVEFKNYGFDVGLISLLLFNFIQLKKDEAIFTKAGIPHAYLGGNIVECMANSDNVVRAGLTSKFKDISTLTKILEIESTASNVEIKTTKNIAVYLTPTEEFRIERITLNKEFQKNKFKTNGINIFLVLDGIIEISFGSNKLEIYKKGEAFLIPDCLKKFSINMKNDSKIFRVTVPIGISA